MSERTCTAVVRDGEEPPNVLFTPPCDCPNCAPVELYDGTSDEEWVRRSGDRQRYRVEVLDLGPTGRHVLG